MKRKIKSIFLITLMLIIQIINPVTVFANDDYLEDGYWCWEGGSHHVITEGIGWYSSYNEAKNAAYGYLSSHDNAISYEIQECDCGFFTVYIRFPDTEHTHTWNNASITKQATCLESGTLTYTCDECGATKTESIPALGHNYKTTVIAPTCTADGYTKYTCTRCGNSYVSNYTKPTGHSYRYEQNKNNTHTKICTVCGVASTESCKNEQIDNRYICTLCGAEYEEQEPTTEHTHIWDSGTVISEPTCTEEVLMTYTCSVCGKMKQETLPTSHKYNKTIVSPTCTEQGYTLYCCDYCGVSYVSDYTEPTGHSYKYESNKNNTHTKICTVCGFEATENCSYKTNTTKATISKNGSLVTKCTICGEIKSKSTVYYPKTIKLEATTLTYNGKVRTPKVSVKGSDGKTISSSNYTVSYASGKKNVGKYSVKVTFKGKYSGTKTLYFTIKPKAASVSSLKAGSKKFTVKWKKQSTQVTGYQIQYSTSSKFTSPKYVTVSSYKTTSKTVKKLKSKKKYYVRIRTYKTVNGTKYYSAWSKAKSVTTKK